MYNECCCCGCLACCVGCHKFKMAVADRRRNTVFVRNIGEDISTQDLIDLFGLHKTPFLKANTSIGFMQGATQKTAVIDVLDEVYGELLKLNGISFKGHDLIVSPHDNPANDASNVAADTAPPTAEGPIQYLEINVRVPEWSFNQVTDIEIAQALDLDFETDPTKSVEDLGRYKKSLQGIFRIDSNDYTIYHERSIKIRGRDFAFTPRYENQADNRSRQSSNSFRPARKEGTLITIYRAYRAENRHLHNEVFDDHFRNIGLEIFKSTLPQFRKGSSCLNNNRYLVVQKLDNDPELKKKIGSFIVVSGVRFNIVYNGMQKYCYACNREHGSDFCPTKARNGFLETVRKGVTGKRKIYSDSILAFTNQAALTTDVACMPGGGIGQIINVIAHDEKHEEKIIFGGTNEIVYSKNTTEFVFTIDKSLEKLQNMANEITTSFVLPVLPLSTPEMKAKAQYLEEEIRKLEKVNVIKPENVDHDGIHPTEDGTTSLLKQVDQSLGEIILNDAEDDDLTTRRYMKVQALYKVGCRACDDPAYSAYLCMNCKGSLNVDVQNVARLEEMIKKAEEEMYPRMEPTNDKRQRSSDNEDDRDPKASRTDA